MRPSILWSMKLICCVNGDRTMVSPGFQQGTMSWKWMGSTLRDGITNERLQKSRPRCRSASMVPPFSFGVDGFAPALDVPKLSPLDVSCLYSAPFFAPVRISKAYTISAYPITFVCCVLPVLPSPFLFFLCGLAVSSPTRH